MEKFSNSRRAYWSQIKIELLDLNDLEIFRFQYLEMGQLLSHGFSVTQTDKNPKQLIIREWNAEYDNKRFNKGIFNVDRLAITDRKVELNSRESKTIDSLLGKELGLSNWEGIVLDGLFCQIEIGSEKFEWNSDEEASGDLMELVKVLRNKSGT